MMNHSMNFEKPMKKEAIGPKTFLEYVLDKYPEDDENWSRKNDGLAGGVRIPDMVATPVPSEDFRFPDKEKKAEEDHPLEDLANEAEHLPKTIPNRYALLVDMPEEVGEILKALGYEVRHEEGYHARSAIRDVHSPEYGLVIMPQTADNMETAKWSKDLTSIVAPVTVFYDEKANMKSANSEDVKAYAARELAEFAELVKRLTPEEETPVLETDAEEMDNLPSIPKYARPQGAKGRVTQQIEVVAGKSDDVLRNIAASAQHYNK